MCLERLDKKYWNNLLRLLLCFNWVEEACDDHFGYCHVGLIFFRVSIHTLYVKHKTGTVELRVVVA